MSQTFKKTLKPLTLLACALGLSACGGGSDSPVVTPLPPPPAQTAFNQFVIDQFAATADDTEPVPVDAEDFQFADDPDAFESLLQ